MTLHARQDRSRAGKTDAAEHFLQDAQREVSIGETSAAFAAEPFAFAFRQFANRIGASDSTDEGPLMHPLITTAPFADALVGPVCYIVSRYEGGRAVEHWDNMQRTPALTNSSGLSMVDGEMEIRDVQRMLENKTLIARYVEDVL